MTEQPPRHDPERISLRFDRSKERNQLKKLLRQQNAERVVEIDHYYIPFMLDEMEVAINAPTFFAIYNATRRKP